jgi:hypothetical protein
MQWWLYYLDLAGSEFIYSNIPIITKQSWIFHSTKSISSSNYDSMRGYLWPGAVEAIVLSCNRNPLCATQCFVEFLYMVLDAPHSSSPLPLDTFILCSRSVLIELCNMIEAYSISTALE